MISPTASPITRSRPVKSDFASFFKKYNLPSLAKFFIELDRSVTLGLIGRRVKKETGFMKWNQSLTPVERELDEKYSKFLEANKEKLIGYFSKKVKFSKNGC